MAATAKKVNKEIPTADEERLEDHPEHRDSRIAESAYYKAENRGFEPGHELEDWLEAEREFSV